MFTGASISPTHFTPLIHENPLLSLLETCKSMEQLKQIHTQIFKTGLSANPSVQNRIINFCCDNESGDLNYACKVFGKIPQPSVFAWNTMIKGYSRMNLHKNGVLMYLDMLESEVLPDRYTFPFLLKGFSRDVALEFGKELHCHVVKFGLDSNVFVQNALMNMYCLCGEIDMASAIFNMSCKNDVVTWNAMLSGYNRSKQYDQTKILFGEMERNGVLPTSITLVLVLSACSKLKDLDFGKRVHRYVKECEIQSNLILENALIDMYAACGETEVALEIFKTMKNRDVISWTAIVMGFVNRGEVDLAREYFHLMPERDSFSWSTMIDGYLRVNRYKDALTLFLEMQSSNMKLDEYTVINALTACGHLGALEIGELIIKNYIDQIKVKNDVFMAKVLIDMYLKCGNVEKARKVFIDMNRRDRFTWSTVIVGLASNGHGEEALDMFSRMLRAKIKPDEVTYIGVLFACNDSGRVDEGRKYFANMTMKHGIDPNLAHYGCMVDLLGRAGHLKEAQEVIKNMPMKPGAIVWEALLRACRVHRDADKAEMAAKEMLKLDPENGTVYALLCNIYAACDRFDDLHKVKKMMNDRGIKKNTGCSLMEMNGVVHEFVAGDKSSPRTKEIYLRLDKMAEDLKSLGYSHNTSKGFVDIGEEEKESAVHRHSEKLAMAFGLINSGPGVTIRIVKNLRMCDDCHHMMKLMSKVHDRELVVRDKSRVHHFRQGSCSCKDYW